MASETSGEASSSSSSSSGLEEFVTANIWQGSKASGVGTFRIGSNGIGWKAKDGRRVAYAKSDIQGGTWRQIAPETFELVLVSKGGGRIKFGGFRQSAWDSLEQAFAGYRPAELKAAPLATSGHNWGEISIKYNTLSLVCGGDKVSFELPLSDVSHCSVQKNEVTVKFHEYDTVDTKNADTLTELRFFVSPNNHRLRVRDDEEGELESPAHKLKSLIDQGSDRVGSAGQGLVMFPDVRFLAPRSRYELEFHPTYMTMHGKSSDLKILYESIVRLHYLPRFRHHILIFSLHPPLRKGATPYSQLIAEFRDEDPELDAVPVNIPPADLDARYGGQLPESLSGPAGEAIIKVCTALMNKRVTRQGTFTSVQGYSYVRCSVKANEGFLYFLDRALFFVIKPAIYIRFEEIDSFEFTRVSQSDSASTNYFDLKITMKKTGIQYEFNHLAKAEYSNIFHFLSQTGVRIKGGSRSSSSAADHPLYDDQLGDDVGDDDNDDDDDDDDDDEDDEEYAPGNDEDDDDYDQQSDNDDDDDDDDDDQHSSKRARKE